MQYSMEMNYTLSTLRKLGSIFSFLMLITVSAWAQQKDSTGLIAHDVILYNSDPLGNIYYTDNRQVLSKYDKNAKRTITYSNMKNGRIGAIDVNNPMRIMVYYPDFFVIKFLDANLAEINSYNIREAYSDGMVKLICSSNNNGFWMYDESNRTLLKIAYNFSSEQESGDLFQILGRDIAPLCMIEKGDELFLSDPDVGIMVFDLFGGSKKIIPIKGIKEFSIEKDVMFYFTGNKIMGYGLKTRSEELKTFFTDKDIDSAKPYLNKSLVMKQGALYLK